MAAANVTSYGKKTYSVEGGSQQPRRRRIVSMLRVVSPISDTGRGRVECAARQETGMERWCSSFPHSKCRRISDSCWTQYVTRPAVSMYHPLSHLADEESQSTNRTGGPDALTESGRADFDFCGFRPA